MYQEDEKSSTHWHESLRLDRIQIIPQKLYQHSEYKPVVVPAG